MDYNWNINLSTLLKINKGVKVNVSTKGTDTTTIPYLDMLTSHFSHNTINIRRGNKTYPLVFPLKFVAYDEKNLVPFQDNAKPVSTPFLHLFFLSSASVDEYKASVRYNVSEWFATLSNKSETQWLIVAETTRAREKKNRSQILDKLKNDFNKHQQRLVEIYEPLEQGSLANLIENISNCLVSYYQTFIESWEKYIRRLKDNRDDSWRAFQYANEQMEYARFFWSLGSLEYALKLYDELDAFVYTLLSSSKEDSTSWISEFQGPLKLCPKFSETIHLNTIEEDYRTFLCLRHVLVSQQILITLCIYQQRLRSNTGVAPSIRVDFAGILLRYASHCLQIVVEHGTLHQLLPDNYRLAAWKIYLISETFSLCNLLAEPSSIEGVTSATCHLHTTRFQAILDLSDLLSESKSSEREGFLSWFKKTDSSLSDALRSNQSFMTQVQKAFDSTSVFLVQAGRTRSLGDISAKFAKYLKKNGQASLALTHELKHVCNLIENGVYPSSNFEILRDLITRLGKKDDVTSILTFSLFLSLQNENLKENYQTEFLELLSNLRDARMRCLPIMKCPVSVRAVDIGVPMLIPGEAFTFNFKFVSEFSFEIPSCHFEVLMSFASADLLAATRPTAFQIGYDKEEGKALMSCVFNENTKNLTASPQKDVLFESSSLGVTMRPGENDVSLTGVPRERGFYVLSKVTVFLMERAMLLEVPLNQISLREVGPMFIVLKTPNKIDVQMPKLLISGISQSICISLEAGMQLDNETMVTIETRTKEKFLSYRLNEKWEISSKNRVPPLQKGDRHLLQIELCRHLDGKVIMRNDEFKEKLYIEWMGQVWPVELTFVPLFTLSSSTTQLEANCLLEAELCRPTDSEWTMIIDKALVEIKDNQKTDDGNEKHEDQDKPIEILAQLLNPELPILSPSSVGSLIWMLGKGSDRLLQCQITFKYSVIHRDEKVSIDSNRETYSFVETMEVVAPKVDFELCAQMLSQNPGAQLCRAGTPCDMVINLRSLTNRVGFIFVTLAADKEMWSLDETTKLLQIKDSGIAQVVFTVTPCHAGFLPFPLVEVFGAHANQQRSGDGFWSEEFALGAKLIIFQRTAGKQIRVLEGIDRVESDLFNDSELRDHHEHRDNNIGKLRGRIGKLLDTVSLSP